MKHKRKIELRAFLTLEEQLKRLENNTPFLTYGYYMHRMLLRKLGLTNGGHLLKKMNLCDAKLHLRPSQYMHLSREAWLFLQSIYGGGPEVNLLFPMVGVITETNRLCFVYDTTTDFMNLAEFC
ncbi:unnamed protein product [Brugia pahangi]|uniref:FERM domain-containing protein n=1 Tax=Brugia pahangi TaxID=6280 RepID=A0A0N4T2P0_BRUPA|nr:unnamed protein product [Brugia pahangi]